MLKRLTHAFVAMLSAAALIAGPATAQDVEPAEVEAYIQDGASRVLTVLGDDALTLDEKKDELRVFVDEFVDVIWVAKRVLGSTYRTTPEDTFDAFAASYRAYATSEYEQYLDDYAGQQIVVTGSRIGTRGLAVVDAQLLPRPGDDAETIDLKWVVRAHEDGWRVRDILVKVSGGGEISLLTQQQEHIAALLSRNGGRVGAVIAELDATVASREAADAQTDAAPDTQAG